MSDVLQVSGGWGHTCAVLKTGRVYCWGANEFGQLGNGMVGGDSLRPVEVQGIDNAASISAGFGFTCALTRDRGVRCWGENAYGQLGDGTNATRSRPVTVSTGPGSELRNVSSV